MANFTWKAPEELKDVESRVTPQDLQGRYSAERDIDPESVKAWNQFVKELSEPVSALTTFLETTQPLERSVQQKRVFISHRMDAADWAERVAWLASTSAGLEYWLDVHDPVLRWATTTLHPTDPRYAAAIAAIIEMALLNCTHVIALHTPANLLPGDPRPYWIPSQWIPYEIGRAKSRKVFSDQMSGWFHPKVHPPESRGEYVLLADRCFSDGDVETWLISQGTDTRNNQSAQKTYLGKGKQIPPTSLP